MTQEAFCPEHGPYDASLGACPYSHSGASPRPGAPISLEDDLPTNLGESTASTALATGNNKRKGKRDEEDATEMPLSYRSKQQIMDNDMEDSTGISRNMHDDDFTQIDAPAKVVLGVLWVKEGPRRGRLYPIKHNTAVGRKEGDIMLDDQKVSGLHAKFTMEDDDFILWDFGSANGTYVNNKKIRDATTLEENDLIKFGDTLFVLKLLEPKPKRKAPRSAPAKKSKK